MKFIKKHKKLFIVIAIILIIFMLFGIYIGIGVIGVKKNITKLQADITNFKAAQSQKNFQEVQNILDAMKPDISAFQGNLNYFEPFKYVPYINNYYNNASHLLLATESIENGAIKIAQSAAPIANSLGYGNNPIQGSGKIAVFVNALPQLVPGINASLSDFTNAQKEFALVDPKYIPAVTVKGVNIKSSFSQYRDSFNQLVEFLPKVSTIAPVIEHALGNPTPTNYLLLFQNDKELRPGGGFITVYGYLTFNKGSLADIKSNNITVLDNLETLVTPAPIQLQQYNNNTRLYTRDGNLSPDIPTDAKQIEQLYDSIPKAPSIDGVVFIDTQFVSALLKVLGPIYVPQYNETVTADNVAYKLELYSEKIDANVQGNRKQFVNYVLTGLKSKIFSAQKDDLLNLINTGMAAITQKHVSMYADNTEVENTLLQYNWGGQFPQKISGDFLGYVEANLGGAKDDFYIKRTISNSLQNTSQGILKTVTVRYEDDQIYDGWLNEPYKAWVRFYVPNGSQLVSLSGVDSKLGTDTVNGTLRQYTDLGYTVFDDHIVTSVRTVSNNTPDIMTVTLKYYLPANVINLASGYSFYAYKEPGISDIQYNVSFNGQTQSADITSDKTFIFGVNHP